MKRCIVILVIAISSVFASACQNTSNVSSTADTPSASPSINPPDPSPSSKPPAALPSEDTPDAAAPGKLRLALGSSSISMTEICRQQYHDPDLHATTLKTAYEWPGYWIKCVDGSGESFGGVDLDRACRDHGADYSFNPHLQSRPTDQHPEKPWAYTLWRCIYAGAN